MNRLRIEKRWLPDLRLGPGIFLPLLAGLAAYGWRVACALLIVYAGAYLTRLVLNRLRTFTAEQGRLHLLLRCGLITLFLPATLADADRAGFSASAGWPALLSAGVLVSLLTWLISRLGWARCDATVLTLLLLALAGPRLIETNRVLQAEDAFTADLLDPHTAVRPTSTAEPWLSAAPREGPVVWIVEPASQRLAMFVEGRLLPGRPAQTITRLVSDDLPPLEDLVIGAHPGRVGQTSAIALLVGGLFMVYRGVVAFRLPVIMLTACVSAMLVLPMPVLVGHNEIIRKWLFVTDPSVGWAMGVTLINYIITASPILLTTLLLATIPGIRPTGGRAAKLFALAFGICAAVATINISFHYGALIALALVQFFTPSIERYFAR